MPDPEYEDATQAWGILAANELVADYQLIAWSGSGVSTYSTADNFNVDAAATPWQSKYPTFPEFWPQVFLASAWGLAMTDLPAGMLIG